MDEQWQQYGNETHAQRHGRYSQAGEVQSQQQQQQQSADPGYGYKAYQTPTFPSQSQSMGASPIATPQAKSFPADGAQDVTMEDADPYNKAKYPSRPNHQQRPSGQFLSQQDLNTGGTYSPSKALSPSSPYTPNSAHGLASYTPYASQNTSARQSPTRMSH